MQTFFSAESYNAELRRIMLTEREPMLDAAIKECLVRNTMEEVFVAWLSETDGDEVFHVGCSEPEKDSEELFAQVRQMAKTLDAESGGKPHSFAQIHSAVTELLISIAGPGVALRLLKKASDWGGLECVNPAKEAD